MKPQVDKIASLNPDLEYRDGFFAEPQDTKAVQVQFTNAKEEQVISVISKFDDCSTDSAEVDANQGTWDYVNSRTSQFLHALDFSKVRNALEISYDYGNLSRLLGEKVEHVEVIKPTTNIARASAYRCADLINVGTVRGSVTELTLPDHYYDLIVVADIERLAHDRAESQQIIEKLVQSLNKQGVLALVTANPTPVSAWFNDQQEVPYAGLYKSVKTAYPIEDWALMLDAAGATHRSEHCFLPNARNGSTLLARSYLENEPSAINHFYGCGICGSEKLNEYLLFSQLKEQHSLFELCDDYLTICGRESESVTGIYDNEFTHFSGNARRLHWRTMTAKPRGVEQVFKYSLAPQDAEISATGSEPAFTIKQDLSPQTYHRGQSLAGKWLHTLTQPDSIDIFEDLLDEYHDWLEREGRQYGDSIYDLLPFNIIVDEQGIFQVIDPEWQISQLATPEFVMFRALFWFAVQNRHLLRSLATEKGLFCLQDFVDYGMQHLGYEYDPTYCSETESKILALIEKRFNPAAIKQLLHLPIILDKQEQIQPLLPNVQIFFCENSSSVDFKNCRSVAITKLDQYEEVTTSLTALDTEKPILRVDPVDRAGFFRFESLSVMDAGGGVLWALDDADSIIKMADVSNTVHAEPADNGLMIALNDDPQFIFDLSDVEGMINAASIALRISYSYSKDYQIAMQELGRETLRQAEFISSQRNELNTVKTRFDELTNNFEFLKTVSEDQNELIEDLSEQLVELRETSQAQIEEQQQALVDQQAVIEAQLEMMQRTFSARVKNFYARMRGINPEPEPEVPVELEPVVEHKPEKLGQNNEDYALWIKQHELSEQDQERIHKEIAAMPLKPKFSVVIPVYDIDEEYLMLAINSMRDQLYPYWELCLVDDASPKAHIRPMLKRLAAMDDRIVVRLNKANQGIAGASNDAVRMTTGDYIGLLDHDDELSIDALYENAKVINREPTVGFIYSDEDKVTMDERRVDPFFKPDYCPDLLDSQNYICHFSVMSQEVVEKIGGFRLGFDGSQDHDIIIRAIQNSEKVVHIPKVLYHWRKVPGSTAEVYDAKSYAWEAGRKAVQARFEQDGEKGEVVLGPLQGTYQVKREIVGDPKVSIVIPFKDRPDLLETCVDSIMSRAESFPNFEIIGVSNNSEEDATHELMAEFQSKYDNVRFVEKNIPFNFSALCNFGVAESDGDFILLLNNDIEIRSDDWLTRLVEHAQRKDVGAVGAKLFFPDGRIQHAGVVVGMFEAAGHSHLYFAADDIGYYGSLMVTREVSAVTGALLMVSRAKFDQVGGLDEENLAVAYNDVDFCLKLVDAGYRNIYTPFVHAIHYESASRGYEDNPEKAARLKAERDYFCSKWERFLAAGDPCFNPNFDLNHFDFKIRLDSGSNPDQ